MIEDSKLSYRVRWNGPGRDADLVSARSSSMTLLMQPHGKSWLLGLGYWGSSEADGEPLFWWRLWGFSVDNMRECWDLRLEKWVEEIGSN
jgi:hypothetical protein